MPRSQQLYSRLRITAFVLCRQRIERGSAFAIADRTCFSHNLAFSREKPKERNRGARGKGLYD